MKTHNTFTDLFLAPFGTFAMFSLTDPLPFKVTWPVSFEGKKLCLSTLSRWKNRHVVAVEWPQYTPADRTKCAVTSTSAFVLMTPRLKMCEVQMTRKKITYRAAS